jgi:hypothetical protein
MVKRRRRYSEQPDISFHQADYTVRFGEKDRSFDLLISQWAGPVGQACRRYLKPGGMLLANDSHGDASLASLDRRYELIAVVNKRGSRYSLSDRDLTTYFAPKPGKPVTRAGIEQSGKGGVYVRTAGMYLFRRVR